MLDTKTVGTILRETRRQRGLTQRQLAKAAHVGENSVTRYERGQSDPPLDALIRIADALDVRLSYLLLLAENRANANARTEGR